MNFYLFPKNLQECTLDEMLDKTAELGFDGVTALIRDGFWLNNENVKAQLPLYISAARKRGLMVDYADTDLQLFGIGEDQSQTEQLKILADNGIKNVRMQHVTKHEQDDVRTYSERFKRQCFTAEKAAQNAGVRVVVQIHGFCYPHNATSAYEGMKDLNPKYIGTKIDPGNNFAQEGYELFRYQIQLLNEYIAALGAKDAICVRAGEKGANDKGWRRAFVPSYDGMTDYHDVFKQLFALGLDVPVVLMPFYASESKDDFFEKLRLELLYFKSAAQSAKL